MLDWNGYKNRKVSANKDIKYGWEKVFLKRT